MSSNKMWVLKYLWERQGMLASALAEDYKAQLMMLRPTIWIMVPNMVYLHSNSCHFLQYFSKVFQGDAMCHLSPLSLFYLSKTSRSLFNIKIYVAQTWFKSNKIQMVCTWRCMCKHYIGPRVATTQVCHLYRKFHYNFKFILPAWSQPLTLWRQCLQY